MNDNDFDYSNEWPDKGLLSYVGYHVGKSGKSPIERRKILSNVFLSELPNVQNPQYMKEWGQIKSSQRLRKIANSLASFIRNAKRKNEIPDEAINDWENDLDWLKKKYYRGVFTFPWPSTEVKRL